MIFRERKYNITCKLHILISAAVKVCSHRWLQREKRRKPQSDDGKDEYKSYIHLNPLKQYLK